MRLHGAAILALLPALALALGERGGVTDLRCEVGRNAIAAPATLAPKQFERPPVGAIAPQGWLLEQLLLQSNSLAGYLSDSSFPGADHVNTSAWSGGDGSKASLARTKAKAKAAADKPMEMPKIDLPKFELPNPFGDKK